MNKLAEVIGQMALSMDNQPNPDDYIPPRPRPDCPVCMVPMPFADEDQLHETCCGKLVCIGCVYSAEMQRIKDMGGKNKGKKGQKAKRTTTTALTTSCPFCRSPVPKEAEVELARIEKLVAKGDALAMAELGTRYRDGIKGVKNDEAKAIQLYRRASELGEVRGTTQLAIAHMYGLYGVDVDEEKREDYLRQAVEAGHMPSRHVLAGRELSERGNLGAAIYHLRIAASAGQEESLDLLQKMFKKGLLSKADFEKTIRSFHAAQGEVKSDARDAAQGMRDIFWPSW